MNQLNLTNGLIAFGGSKGIGKTRFALKLANHLAKIEKVLYISYQDYKEKLNAVLIEMDSISQKKLEINTSFDYFSVSAVLNIYEYIEKENITTIFLDDVDCFNRNEYNEFNEFFEEERDSIINSLHFISKHLNIRLIFNIELPLNHTSRKPTIRDFNWSRKIINHCSQIFAIYRPAFHGFSEDESGNSLTDKIEILRIKSEQNENEILEFSNNELRMFHD